MSKLAILEYDTIPDLIMAIRLTFFPDFSILTGDILSDPFSWAKLESAGGEKGFRATSVGGNLGQPCPDSTHNALLELTELFRGHRGH